MNDLPPEQKHPQNFNYKPEDNVPASKVTSINKQVELEHPEMKADKDYDENVTIGNPIKYIMQKWCCRRKRTVKYKVTDEIVNAFDDRRLIDVRFWLYVQVVSNIYY